MGQYSSVKPLNLATLHWLDRRRVWATPLRETALGVTQVPVYPTLISGQAGRPGLSHKYFTPTFTWVFNIIFLINWCVLSLVVTLNLLKTSAHSLLGLGLIAIDGRLHAAVTPVSLPKVEVEVPNFSPLSKLENLSTNIDLAHSLYSSLALCDATSAFLPTAGVRLVNLNSKANVWGVFPSTPNKGWDASLSALLNRNPAALFRSYLGEWRRLGDQFQATPAGMWLVPTSGVASGHHPRAALTGHSFKDMPKPRPSLSTNVPNQSPAPSYSYYLSTPWVF